MNGPSQPELDDLQSKYKRVTVRSSLQINYPTKQELEQRLLHEYSGRISAVVDKTDHLWLPDKILVCLQTIIELRERCRSAEVRYELASEQRDDVVRRNKTLNRALWIMIFLCAIDTGVIIWLASR